MKCNKHKKPNVNCDKCLSIYINESEKEINPLKGDKKERKLVRLAKLIQEGDRR